uniref:Uncharacterized protein n=1 Tax=viral metagenome TaxID=1070528 RepID=A0A6H2A672_9ZZZZ
MTKDQLQERLDAITRIANEFYNEIQESKNILGIPKKERLIVGALQIQKKIEENRETVLAGRSLFRSGQIKVYKQILSIIKTYCYGEGDKCVEEIKGYCENYGAECELDRLITSDKLENANKKRLNAKT